MTRCYQLRAVHQVNYTYFPSTRVAGEDDRVIDQCFVILLNLYVRGEGGADSLFINQSKITLFVIMIHTLS